MLGNALSMRCLGWCLSALLIAASHAATEVPQRFEQGGVSVEFSVAPTEGAGPVVAGTRALATLKLTDSRSGRPVSGLAMRAWFALRRSEMVANEAQCTDKAKSFMQGLMSVRADADLNGFVALTLNHDKTVSVINPQVAFNISKLENLIVLPGLGADWVLSADQSVLFITLPSEDAVAVVDVSTRKLKETIALGKGVRPTRLALSPDGARLWVGLDGSAELAVMEVASGRIIARRPAGAGLHAFAFSGDAHYVAVTASADDMLTIVDLNSLALLGRVKVGKTPVSTAFSAASGFFYVGSLNAGSIDAVDPIHRRVAAHIPVKRGTTSVVFPPGETERPWGRHGLALNQLDSTITAFDVSDHRVVASAPVAREPTEIAFTRRYAYVRGLATEKFSLFELDGLSRGRLNPLEIQAGRQAPAASPEHIGPAAMMAPLPDGGGTMIANASDRTLYVYQEGMMAPSGTLSNYKRAPRALMILDEGIKETEPGVYSAQIKLRRGGRFDVPVVIDSPRLVHCFTAQVEQSAERPTGHAAVKVDALTHDVAYRPGTVSTLKVRVTDVVSGALVAGLRDVETLLVEPPGSWRRRQTAHELEQGVYTVNVVFPREGDYTLALTVPSRGAAYADLPPFPVHVALPKEQ